MKAALEKNVCSANMLAVHHFYARLSHRNSVCPSVCLSVCPSHGWISQKRCKL